MPLVELPCVFALLYLWCWACVEVAVRAGRSPYWGAAGLFCNPLVVLLFVWPSSDVDPALPPHRQRLWAALWLSVLHALGFALLAAWALGRT